MDLTSTGSGWTCLSCGTFVGSGQFHNCVELYPDTPDMHPTPVGASYTTSPAMDRIANALERIANHLEKVTPISTSWKDA